MKTFRKNMLAAAPGMALASPVWADDAVGDAAAGISQAVPVQMLWNARLRDESVDDAALAKNARAGTLRLRGCAGPLQRRLERPDSSSRQPADWTIATPPSAASSPPAVSCSR